jgi:hypothetical protein
MTIVSQHAFVWVLTVLTFGLAGPWVVYDAFNLWRLRRADRADPIVGDKRFGYVIGMFVGLIGVIGVLKFHLG